MRRNHPLASPDHFRKFLRRRWTREGRLGLYLTVGFLASLVLVVVLGALLGEVFETSAPGSLDRSVTLAVRALQTPLRDRVLRTLTNLGDFRFLVPATVLVSGCLAAAGRRVSGMLFAGSVVGGFLLESAMKAALHRGRPDLWPALVTERSFSFPSGHATMTTLFFGGAAAVVFHVTRRRVARAAALLLATVLILGVGFSRVYLGAHWLTDVLGGMLLGLVWVVLCATGTEYFARRSPARGAAG